MHVFSSRPENLAWFAVYKQDDPLELPYSVLERHVDKDRIRKNWALGLNRENDDLKGHPGRCLSLAAPM